MTETRPRRAAAHIITAEASALGSPEILIMTPDRGLGALLIERHLLPATATQGDGLDALIALNDWQWVIGSDPTHVAPGYVIVDVERI